MSDVLTRAVGIGHATVDAYTRTREQIAADALNRLATEQRYVVACQDALMRLAQLCYVQAGGRYVNIDSLTWRILIPVPWSRAGCSHYGLRDWEARTLGRVMIARQQGPSLFLFGDSRWYVNIADYGTIEAAIDYLDRQRLTVDEWAVIADSLRTTARARMCALRAG